MALNQLSVEDSQQFLGGEFFCSTAEAGWSVASKEWSRKHWEAFGRSENVGIQVRKSGTDSAPFDPYVITKNALCSDGQVPAPKNSTRSESTGEKGAKSKKYLIWPVDIVGNKARRSSEVTHLLPTGHKVHEEWIGVAAAVLGLPKSSSLREQLMATRGVRKQNAAQAI